MLDLPARSALLWFQVPGPGVIILFKRVAPRALIRSFIVAAAVPAVGVWVVVAGSCAVRPATPREGARIVHATHLNLLVTLWPGPVDTLRATGGAIEPLADDYLLALGDGQLYLLSWDPARRLLASTRLGSRVPMNRDEFFRTAAADPLITTGGFRTSDILVQDLGRTFRLAAAHHYWDEAKRCVTVRVSLAEGEYATFPAGGPLAWRTVFESAPCLTFQSTTRPFEGYQIGAKLAALDHGTLLLTLGDHGFDGVNLKPMFPQEDSTAYGKTILIDLAARTASSFSRGHRNAMGLYVSPGGAIWETEHGPRGGDELNLLRPGVNYGWPLVTLGTDYVLPTWPLNPKQGRHEGFEGPVYAWVPSIGISAVVGLTGRLFDLWSGDLVIGSLRDQSLWHVRADSHRVVFAERIPIGVRIRDLMEDRDGRLVLWTESDFGVPAQGAIVIIEPAPVDAAGIASINDPELRGELLFARCAGCHSLAEGQTRGLGPNLAGVAGRPIAAETRFRFSPALQRVEGRWTDGNLAAFLADPQGFAPGTSMEFAGIRDPRERVDLIGYLKTLR